MKNLMLDAARRYVNEYGFSVIPITTNGTKKPLLPWERYQNEKPTDADLKKWFGGSDPANIGIVTGEISHNCVVDIDEYNDSIPSYIPTHIYTPTVCTPRDGKHLHFSWPGFRIGNNQKKIPGVDFRGDGGYAVAPPSHNTNGTKYTWVIDPSQAPLAILPDGYMSLITSTGEVNEKYEVDAASAFNKGRRDDDLFHIAFCLAKGGMEEKEIIFVMCNLAKCCSPPFPVAEVVNKVKSAVKRARRIDVGRELSEWVSCQTGIFDISDIYRDLQITDRNDRKLVSKHLIDMVNDSVIERDSKAGRFRIIDERCERMEWWNTAEEPLDLQLPLGLSELTYVLPKNIICVAGYSNSGKTGFGLEFIRLNMYKYPGAVHYFNSEMGPMELRERLRRFRDTPRDDWRKFHAYERGDNFSDVIRPDEINVIDYIEVNDEFWKVGAMIKEIHDKLNHGMALIFLQKKEGAKYGVGAEFGIHKSRLYLNMEKGRSEIVKCKNFANPNRDPNGMVSYYQLDEGYKFVMKTGWRRETK